MIFLDRRGAGQKLAEALAKYRGKKEGIILAIPRGGVVVGVEMAKELALPLDVVVTKKISAPGNPEFAIGAVGPDGQAHINEKIVAVYKISSEYLDRVSRETVRIVKEKIKNLRGERPYPDLSDKTVILTDDGLATGQTMLAAIEWVKGKNPAKIVVAVPVAPSDTAACVKGLVDEFICLHTTSDFSTVGQFYIDFEQITDKEVKTLLA